MSWRGSLRVGLLILAALSLGTAAYRVIESERTQTRLREELTERRAAAEIDTTSGRTAPVPGWALARAEGELIGHLRIPSARVDAMIVEGVSAQSLDDGVGHFPETPLPGAAGNVALAAHRDTFFARLKDTVVGDTIFIATSWGDYAYLVEHIEVVQPEDVWVLDQDVDSTLTLITCYPFSWFGPAPQRIFFRASLLPGQATPVRAR